MPPRKSMTRGKAIHRATAEYYKNKIGGTNLSLMDYKNLFAESLKNELTNYEQDLQETAWLVDKNYLEKEKQLTEKDLEKSGLRGIEVYYQNEAQKRRMKEIEKELRIQTNLGIDLVGYVDYINETDDIYELKTSVKKPSIQELEKDPQLNYYWLLYKNTSEKSSVMFEKTFLVLTSSPKLVKYQLHSKNLIISDKTMLYYVGNVIKAIQNNIWYCIHKADDWVCSKDWCGYYKLHKELREKGLDWIKEKYGRN